MPRIAELRLQRAQRFLDVNEALHDAVVGLNGHDDGRQFPIGGIACIGRGAAGRRGGGAAAAAPQSGP